MIRRLLPSALIISFVLCLSTSAADKNAVRYKMPKDETFGYTMTTGTEMLQEVMGSEQEIKSNSTVKAVLTSEGADAAGNLVFTLVYDSFVAEIDHVMMDSTVENPPGIVNKRIRKVITPSGDQLESVEVDTIEIGMFSQGGFSSDREFLLDFPEAPLEMGTPVLRSDIDSTAMMGGTMRVQSDIDFTWVGNESLMGYDCMKIDLDGTVRLEGNGTMRGMMDIFLEGDGDVTGTAYFAPAEGVLVSYENIGDFEMTIAVTGQQNMTIPVTQTTKSSLKLEK